MPQEETAESLGQEVGKITHYFDKIGVAVIELSAALKTSDKIRVKGSTTDFTQGVDSMQIDHNPVEEAKAGQSIGMKIAEQARPNDKVYKVE